jgi:hypothetical protein
VLRSNDGPPLKFDELLLQRKEAVHQERESRRAHRSNKSK